MGVPFMKESVVGVGGNQPQVEHPRSAHPGRRVATVARHPATPCVGRPRWSMNRKTSPSPQSSRPTTRHRLPRDRNAPQSPETGHHAHHRRISIHRERHSRHRSSFSMSVARQSRRRSPRSTHRSHRSSRPLVRCSHRCAQSTSRRRRSTAGPAWPVPSGHSFRSPTEGRTRSPCRTPALMRDRPCVARLHLAHSPLPEGTA